MKSRTEVRFLHEEEHSYLASVSDLMAGLLFIFIITLVMFAFQLSRTRSHLTDEIVRINSVQSVRLLMLQTLEKRLEELDLHVEVVADQGILRLTERGIYFPSGDERPASDYADNVGKLAFVLMEVLPTYGVQFEQTAPPNASRPSFCHDRIAVPPAQTSASRKVARLETVLVEGHTDPRPVRSARFHDNWELSGARAAEVFRMMVQCEPNLSTLVNSERLKLLSVSGYAETRPADTRDSTSEKNRRIDLRFMLQPPESSFEPQPIGAARKRLEGLRD